MGLRAAGVPAKKSGKYFACLEMSIPRPGGGIGRREAELRGLACHCRISRMRSRSAPWQPGAADLPPNALGLPLTIVAVDGPPVREIVGQHPPRTAAPLAVQDGVDHRARRRAPIRADRPARRYQRADEPPLVIAQVGRVRSPRHLHSVSPCRGFDVGVIKRNRTHRRPRTEPRLRPTGRWPQRSNGMSLDVMTS